jgi:hypothetical protein
VDPGVQQMMVAGGQENRRHSKTYGVATAVTVELELAAPRVQVEKLRRHLGCW